MLTPQLGVFAGKGSQESLPLRISQLVITQITLVTADRSLVISFLRSLYKLHFVLHLVYMETFRQHT